MRQGPGIGQGPTNSGGSYICIGLGSGPGPTRGGVPYVQAQLLGCFPLFLG